MFQTNNLQNLVFMKSTFGAAGFLAALSLSGCASSEPVALTLSPQARNAPKVIGAERRALIEVVRLTDRREKDAALADLNNRPMDGVDVMTWVQNSLEEIGARVALTEPATIASEAVPDDGACTVEIDLRRVSINPVGTSMTSAVVLGVQRTDAALPYKALRGQVTRMNWASREGETNSALHEAISRAMEQLEGYCATPAPNEFPPEATEPDVAKVESADVN
ncbi:MAG: hypothetical protein R3B98_08160 [Hyphomonas sp.]